MLTDDQKKKRDERIIELTLQDWSTNQIRLALKVSSRTVLNARKSAGIFGNFHTNKAKSAKDRDDQIIRLTRLKVSTKQIAKMLNCSERTVSRVRKNNNCLVQPPSKPFTKDELEKAKAILENGGTYTEAAKTIRGNGSSGQSLKAKLPGYKVWTRKESSNHAALVRKFNKLSTYPPTPRPGIIEKGSTL